MALAFLDEVCCWTRSWKLMQYFEANILLGMLKENVLDGDDGDGEGDSEGDGAADAVDAAFSMASFKVSLKFFHPALDRNCQCVLDGSSMKQRL